jgi:hypothetical protein
VLALFSPLLAAPQQDWPAQTLVTGSVVDDAVHGVAFAAGANAAAPLPPALARFLDAGTPPLVFTLGTSAVLTGGAPRVYAESAAAAAALGRRAVLLTGHEPRNVPPRLPPDVLAVPAASHAALFPRAGGRRAPGRDGDADAGAPRRPADARRPVRARPAGQRRPGRAARRRARRRAAPLPRRPRGGGAARAARGRVVAGARGGGGARACAPKTARRRPRPALERLAARGATSPSAAG